MQEKESNIVAIPFYSVKAAAGVGETLPDYPEKDVIYFDKRWLRNVVGLYPNRNALTFRDDTPLTQTG